jgi:hypothetical protein
MMDKESKKLIDSALHDGNSNPQKDPAGTDPDRNSHFSKEEISDPAHDDSDDKSPKNHTTSEERLLNPERGNKEQETDSSQAKKR